MVNNSCSIKDCINEGKLFGKGTSYSCAIQAVCTPNSSNPEVICQACSEASCASKKLTCGWKTVGAVWEGKQFGCHYPDKYSTCMSRVPEGYECKSCIGKAPVECEDIDECNNNEQPCGGEICLNTDGGYSCSCDHGPCEKAGCQDKLCGSYSCYTNFKDRITEVTCGRDEAELIIVKYDDKSIILECYGPSYMTLAVWYVGNSVMNPQKGQSTLKIIPKNIKTETIVSCTLKSLYTDRTSRDAIVLEAYRSKGKKEKKKKKKETKEKKVKREKNEKNEKKRRKVKKKNTGKKENKENK